MKIDLKCPVCGKEASGEIPDEMGKKKGLTDGQTFEMPCPQCLQEKAVGAIPGMGCKLKDTALKGTTDLKERVEAMREYHKKMLVKEKKIDPVMFTVKGDDVNIFMLNSIMDNKDKAETCIKAVISEVEPDAYFMVTEAWTSNLKKGEKPTCMPSEDPNRKEIVLIYGQHKGGTGMIDSSPFTKFDGEIKFLEPSTTMEDDEASGRFINLLPTE